jgi:hydroxypyruvate isomerase
MPRFAANLSMLWPELPFLDRFEAAARAGFSAVECQFPYAWPAEELAGLLRRHRLALVLHNLPAGDWDRGERGIACLPGREEEHLAGVERAIAYARALGCWQVNCLAGVAPPGEDPARLRATLAANLRRAAERLAAEGIRLLVEPLNVHDVPGFVLAGTGPALSLLEEAGTGNLALQLDAYHAHRMGEDVLASLERALPRLGHVQIADAPGRHEPGTGQVPFPAFFARLDALGYTGWVGCEYLPLTTTEAGLPWLAAWR